MAEIFLRDYPELGQFVLSDVQLTGTRIGGGSYGVVDEVDVPVRAAAKTIYPILLGDHGSADQLPKAAREFVNECQLMSKLRHPNIVQFLGVTFFPDSRLPALVMELLLTSLHDLLDPATPPPPGVNTPISLFSLVLRIIVLQNVASGLAYLHGQTPQVIHRDLSARNILLDSEMVAKIADLGMARIMRERAAATMTKGPGSLVYMPPEASAPAQSNKEKSKYDASIDVFSLGVVTIFTIGGVFPCDRLAATYFKDETGLVLARTELQRRSAYMRHVNEQLRAYGQLRGDRGDHPLIRLIQHSLHNGPNSRPSIHEVQCLLEEARAGIRDGEIEVKKRELVRSLHTQPMKQNLEHVLRDLVTENAVKDRELAESQQLLRQKEHQLQLSKSEKQVQCRKLAESQQSDSYTCQVSGPGLTATVDHPTHVLVELTNYSDRLQLNVTAQLELVLTDRPEATPTKSWFSWFKKNEATPTEEITKVNASVATKSPSRYEVSYTAVNRGQHKLHVQVNDRDINGSPFRVTVYPDMPIKQNLRGIVQNQVSENTENQMELARTQLQLQEMKECLERERTRLARMEEREQQMSMEMRQIEESRDAELAFLRQQLGEKGEDFGNVESRLENLSLGNGTPGSTQPISMRIPDSEMDEAEAMDLLCGIACKWRELGTQFGFKESELNVIQMDSSAITYNCLHKLLHTKIARTVTFGWPDIVKALRAIKENRLADKICRQYNIESHSENPSEIVVLRLNQTSEHRLKVKFASLVTFSINVMEKKGEKCFKDFRSSVISIFQLDQSILQATSYREVFDKISHGKEWDFLTYEPLVELLKPHIEEVAPEYTDYQDAVTAYYATKHISRSMSTMDLTKMSRENEQVDSTIHEMQMKLSPHKVTERSRTYINAVWDSLSKHFCLPSMKRMIDNIPSPDTVTDCITAKISPQTSQLLLEGGKATWKAFMTQNNIMKITLDNGQEISL